MLFSVSLSNLCHYYSKVLKIGLQALLIFKDESNTYNLVKNMGDHCMKKVFKLMGL
jgi:hypothetical protein